MGFGSLGSGALDSCVEGRASGLGLQRFIGSRAGAWVLGCRAHRRGSRV